MKKLLSVLSSTLQDEVRRGLLLLALVASVSTIYASDTEVDGIWYDFDSSTKTASVTYKGDYSGRYYDEYSGSVTIPETVIYNGTTYNVTSIGNYDFQSGDLFYNITSNSTVEVTHAYNTHSITIPRTVTYDSITYIVTSIGESAFNGCSSLTSITIPNSVTTIGYGAFYYCTSLTSITIPNSVTNIGGKAFLNCISLTKTNYTGDIAGWCNIKFGSHNANPMYFSHNFYINDQEIKDLEIPNNVTSIGSSAFYSCSSLTSVTIPNSVTSIGDYAFNKCSGLTSVTIGESVTSIGNYAFNFCSSLTSITIPEGVTSIGDRAFQLCSSLTSINIPNNVTSIGNYAFRSCSSLTSINIPNSITSIGEGTFYNCSSLTSATIGNSVTSIGAEAFYCVNLEEIYCYPTTPPTITEENTFKNYNATLYVPCDSKEAYEEHPVFSKFEKIKGIDDCGGGFVTTHIHETICQGEVYEFGEYLCDTTGTYTAIIGDVTTFLYLTVLPSSIDTITVEACDSYEWRGQVYTISGDYTFHGDKEDSIEQCHTEILHLTISKSKYKEETIVSEGSYEWNGKVLTESGDYVSTLKTVNGCDSILELHLKIVPDEGENNIIYYTSQTGEIVTPHKTDVFGANILSNTYENGLGIITFDGPVTQIGHAAFYETNITSIILPNTVTSIRDAAFGHCYDLTSIVIPNTVTRIGWSAFSYCYDLTSINIPSSVTFIDEYAFNYCESLTSIEIPEGVKSIKQHTFFGCDRLESVVIPNSVQSIGDYAFFWCSSLNSINLPNKLRTIGEYAFRSCPFTSITIPKSVTKIKDRAFNVCKELVSIVVEDGNTTYDSRNNCNAIIETGTNTLITGCATTTIPDDIVSIADGAFYGCNSFGSITIPNSVTKIGNEAFRCSIDTIYCYAITPPELYDEKVFDEYDANLNVPCSSLEAYKSDSLWGKFTNIQCFETTPPSEPQDTTIYHPTEYATICEGEMYTWMGVDFTAAGMFISEEIVEDENYIYHHIYTLELTVIPFSSDTIVVEAYDSYEWHGVVYTESGTYTYYDNCFEEILHLTIIDTPTPPEPEIPTEGIGVFSIGEGKTVTFSQGNLQYTQSTDTWSFAENQYDFLGTANVSNGALADKIDLFGWSASNTTAPFGVSTSTDWENGYSGSFIDWGTNKIGNDAPNTWRTLTYDEWYYLRY
ncbi:MAG: leucine-rich repeat domain-containing protein, partial [Paludibacteraceae bacterium]|nr:leucine-rich repeat domain-containing protein [Paludibacteraceae bacterium]